MKHRSAIFVIAALVLAALAGVLRLANKVDPLPVIEPPVAESTPESETPAEVVDLDPTMPALEIYAATCFRDMRQRNPRGRILSLTANRLADRCGVIVETDQDSGLWMFDWRDHTRGYIQEGELRWPDAWSVGAPPQGITDVETFATEAAALMASVRAVWPDTPSAEWLYEIHWLPEPFSRPLVFVSLADRRPDAAPYASLDFVYDGTQALQGEALQQAQNLYPVTRFELREDHNFKGPIYESTALAEAAISLETADVGVPIHPLAQVAEQCMGFLHSALLGRRVLRVSMNTKECFMVFENPNKRDDYYLISARDLQDFKEHQSLQLPIMPTANLLLDRGRLSAALLRERLTQAQKEGGESWEIGKLAIAFTGASMVWQFDGALNAEPLQIYLDDSGTLIEPPAEFPITAFEVEQGFVPTTPLLPFAY